MQSVVLLGSFALAAAADSAPASCPSASAGTIPFGADRKGTPGIPVPHTHVCLEAMNFGNNMYKMFRNASFERKTYDWEDVWGQGPIGKERFPDMSIKMSKYATEVVDFTVSGVEEIKKLVQKRTRVFQTIKDIFDKQEEMYSNFNLNFDNSILFIPQWLDWYMENEHVVLDRFPQAVSVAANIFHVPKGKVPFGVHNSEHGASTVLRQSWPYWQRVTQQDGPQHVSFHTAIEDQLVPEDQPLVIYENIPAQASNIGYMLRSMKGNHMVDVKRVDEALSAIASNYVPIIQPALNLITCNFLISKYCPASAHEEEGMGYYWPLKAGQSLHFNNYVFHGASTLGPAKKDRYTLDMRVTTYHLNACSNETYYHSNPVVRASFKIAKDCISMIFGYEDYEHLLTVMFNSEIAALCSDAPMFYFATYPSDTSKDLVYADGVPHLYITPNALNNHKKFAADYFSSPDFTMPEKARKCMADAAANPNA